MNKKIMQAIKISALAILLSLGIGYALAWTAPTATPPGGNVSAPINTSATAQTKAGAFTVQGLLTSAGLTLTGTNKITFPDGSTLSTSEPLIQFFKSTPDTIQSGGTTQLQWQTKGTLPPTATPCTITGAGATYANLLQTSAVVSPALTGPGNFAFNLSCIGLNGTTVQENISVNVLAPFSQTFSNGQSGTVNIPYGVTKLTFSGSGGAGGRGYYNPVGGAGGTMISPNGKAVDKAVAGLTSSGGSGGWADVTGVPGGAGGWSPTGGFNGGNCYVGLGGGGTSASGGVAGGGAFGASSSSGGTGGGGAYAAINSSYIPFIALGGGGGAAGYVYGGGGGGGAGGGGGGAGGFYSCGITAGAGGGGGGAAGFFDQDFTPVVSNSSSILLSQIGAGLIAPTSIFIGTGAAGAYYSGAGSYPGTGSTLTVSW